MTEPLKPCPFCGKPPRMPEFYFMDSYWHMGCHDESHPVIEFRAYTRLEGEEAKAAGYVSVIAAWNRRTPSDRERRLLERVVDAGVNSHKCEEGMCVVCDDLIEALAALRAHDAKTKGST